MKLPPLLSKNSFLFSLHLHFTIKEANFVCRFLTTGKPMLSKYKLNQLYFKDTQFANLMTRRIFNVLLIANPYDAFMLEDDGRIDEKIFNEYTSLSLRYPPRFSQVSTEEEALTLLENMTFDLVICMPSTNTVNSAANNWKSSNRFQK